MDEAKRLGDWILSDSSNEEFESIFEGCYSEGFNPSIHLQKIGVVNQTTMLASETQEIADYLKQVMITKFGEESMKDHFADTRDTLCYATNDNQSATLSLLDEEADLAIVVGGYNSSNTSHLVELLEDKLTCFYIRNKDEIQSESSIYSFDIHSKERSLLDEFLPNKEKLKVIITSGASCPDSAVDQVMQRILELRKSEVSIDQLEF